MVVALPQLTLLLQQQQQVGIRFMTIITIIMMHTTFTIIGQKDFTKLDIERDLLAYSQLLQC